MAHVGFVGVGRMGANMARRLQDKGYRITAVHDRNQQAADELSRELGWQWFRHASLSCPRSLSPWCPMMQPCTTSTARGRPTVFSACQGPSFYQLRDGEPGCSHCYGTGCRTTRRRQPGSLASSITQARQGTLYLMCAGKESVFERARPLLEVMSAHLRISAARERRPR